MTWLYGLKYLKQYTHMQSIYSVRAIGNSEHYRNYVSAA